MNTALVLSTRSIATQQDNDAWHSACDLILSHYSSLPIRNVQVAVTVADYRRPADRASKKQLFRINEALHSLLEQGLVEPEKLPIKLEEMIDTPWGKQPRPQPRHS